MSSRFIQIHTLTPYPAALLNRDDAGFAKRIEFGDAVRTRVSSQCLKRHWRAHDGEHSLKQLGEPLAYRSRITFDEKITQPLIAKGLTADVVRPVVAELMKLILGQSAKAEKAEKAEGAEDEKKKGKAEEKVVSNDTSQVTVLGPKEIAYLLTVAEAIAREVKPGKDLTKAAEKALKEKLGSEGKKNLQALGKAAAGLDASVFGRMVTGDYLARVDSAIHVAHAFTVHAQQTEADYFSAIDELKRDKGGEDAQGSGHINSSELTSGLYYGYVVVDVPLLVANLEGVNVKDWEKADKKLAQQVVQALIHLVSTVSPGAKLGSTAPHSAAHLVLVESGNAQPRTLANAFLKSVSATVPQRDLLGNTYAALGEFVAESDEMYPSKTQRQLAAMHPPAALLKAIGQEKKVSVPAVAEWAAGQV
jgi:CRISPR system Cascade subunit CasC